MGSRPELPSRLRKAREMRATAIDMRQAVRMTSRRWTLTVAGLGVLLVTGYAVVAALQILVLNPLAGAPGRTLSEIHADMAAMNESPGTAFVLGILGLGVLLAVLLLGLLARRADATPFAAACAYLVMLVLGAPVYFVASFGPGMALADTYFIGGADYSPWALPLYAVSLLALVGLMIAIVTHRPAAVGAPAPVLPA